MGKEGKVQFQYLRVQKKKVLRMCGLARYRNKFYGHGISGFSYVVIPSFLI